MYYSNDSQSTLSIIYVDFLIMATEKGSGRYLDFLSSQTPLISAACSSYFSAGFYWSSPGLHQSSAYETHIANILNQSDSCNEAIMAWQDFSYQSDGKNYLGSVADDWETHISGTKKPECLVLYWSHCESYEWNDEITTFW